MFSGDLVHWGVREICKRRLWKQVYLSLSRGPVWESGGGLVYRGLIRQIKVDSGNRASVPVEAMRGESAGKTPLQGTLKDT